MLIAVIILLLMIILYICTFKYKREAIKKLNRNKHKLKFLYGLSMYIVTKIFKNKYINNKTINQAFKELVVKESSSEEKYLYVVKKVAISITVIFCTCACVVAIGISESMNYNETLKMLKRSSDSDRSYEIVAKDDEGKEEKVKVNVARKKYKEKDIYKIFEKRQKDLIKRMLGENKSLEHIDKPLNLISSIGTEGIIINWSISDSTIIGYDGKLSGRIPKEGKMVQLTVTFTLDKVSEDFIYSANVFPQKNKTLQEAIQAKIDAYDVHSNSVTLPGDIDGTDLSYSYPVEKKAIIVLLIGITVSIGLFFLKDTDLRKSQRDRKNQLMEDYPEIVSMTLLYYEAGLSIKTSFQKIIESYRNRKDRRVFRYAYEELEMCVIKMKSGVSEQVAISEYGNRCGIHSYIKFAGLIEQNMKRGTRELSLALRGEMKAAMLEKKNNMLKNGGQMSTKLMGPMVLMLIISIVIIMVPAFMSMGI